MGHTQGCTSPGKMTCDPPVGSESERKPHPCCFQVQALKWGSVPSRNSGLIHTSNTQRGPPRTSVSSFPSRPRGGIAQMPSAGTEALNRVLVTWRPRILAIPPGMLSIHFACVRACVCVCVCVYFFLGLESIILPHSPRGHDTQNQIWKLEK